MKKVMGICIVCLFLCGCANPYEKAVRDSLGRWGYWKELYYIQDIHTYEMLRPYYIQGIPYVEIFVNVVNKYDPYEKQSFNFFVDKERPDSRCIPNNQEWRDWNKKVWRKVINELESAI